MVRRLTESMRRARRTPPGAILRWLWRQVRAEVDQVLAPERARRLSVARLLQALEAESLDAAWDRLAKGPHPFVVGPLDPADYDWICAGDRERILDAAETALARRVDLLGSGPVDLGRPTDWHRDYKSGRTWPLKPFRRLDLLDLGRPSDVKFPWEVSRLQWMIPVGQAYALTGDDRYAGAVRETIEEWADANPVARGVNWACTMDVALRAITLVWLFGQCQGAPSWRDDRFRRAVLRLLYGHGDFISRHLEWSDVNGNHLTADAAGLVVVGHVLGDGPGPRAWQRDGWAILSAELPRQVHADGTNFEASAAYHRLVLELFLLAALCRKARGLPVEEPYRRRLVAMAEFVAAYCPDDGQAPLWGDADDGRVLPLGGQPIGDHRYLVPIVGAAFGAAHLAGQGCGADAEVFWLLGGDAARKAGAGRASASSRAFPDGGVYIMRGDGDHVFVDCGPVGMAGRGGHGHNDCLSFEARLDGTTLITDCGAFVYSASVEWRNRFRGTEAHNTPMIDGEEQNRFVHPHALWSLHDDAHPRLHRWECGPERDIFVGSHDGYARLPDPVVPVRGVLLDKSLHGLVIVDRFEGRGDHRIVVPYHLAPGVEPERLDEAGWRLDACGREYLLIVDAGAAWQVRVEDRWCSPSYGTKVPIRALVFARDGPLEPLTVAVRPAAAGREDAERWTRACAGMICSGPAVSGSVSYVFDMSPRSR